GAKGAGSGAADLRLVQRGRLRAELAVRSGGEIRGRRAPVHGAAAAAGRRPAHVQLWRRRKALAVQQAMAGKRIMPRRHTRVVLRISSRAAGGFADTLGRCAPVSPAAIMTPHTRALTAAGISSSALTRAAGLRAIRRVTARTAASASRTGRTGT